MPAPKAVRPALLRSWREAVWRDQDYWTWLLIILGVLLAIRLLVLVFAETDLFFDEAQYWSWSRDLAFGCFSKPPLIGWVIRFATEVCGEAEWCVRAPSPILYTVPFILLFFAARALYGDRVGFWSAVVFATLPAAPLSSPLIPEPVLYVTLNRGTTCVPKRCHSAQVIGGQQFSTDALPVREGRFYLLKGYEGDHAD